MKVVAEIFSQGEEIVSGQTVDSNAAWLSEHLRDMGFVIKRHTAVGDDLPDLTALIEEIANRADCCICTGGLGPTVDDLTAEAVSLAANQRLILDTQALQQIEAYYLQRQRAMPPANRNQAYFPQHAVRIDNPVGTAPGFALQIKRCWFVFLPGVPSEMKAMFAAVREQLLARFSLQPDKLVSLRSIGIGESAIQQCLEDLNLPSGVQLGFRATVDEVQTKLLFSADFPQTELNACVQQIASLIGDCVFAIDGLDAAQGGDLLTVIDQRMTAKNYCLAVLETASHGLLAAKCLGKDWLQTTLIAKDSLQAAEQWAVQVDDLATLAESLAAQLKQQQQTDFALVQLYSGTQIDYQRKDKTIVLYNCLQTDAGVFHRQHTLGGGAQTKQNQAALLSLDLLRRYLQNTCL
jgi:competence/damage-inducible protein CinA-like protein